MGCQFQNKKRTKTYRMRLRLQTALFIPVHATRSNIETSVETSRSGTCTQCANSIAK